MENLVKPVVYLNMCLTASNDWKYLALPGIFLQNFNNGWETQNISLPF